MHPYVQLVHTRVTYVHATELSSVKRRSRMSVQHIRILGIWQLFAPGDWGAELQTIDGIGYDDDHRI